MALHEALARRGVEFERPVWNDAGVDWSRYLACLIRTTWDYQEQRDAFVAWAQRVSRETRLFNPVDIVRWNTHKSYLRDLERRGVEITPTVWLERGAQVDLKTILDARRWCRAFLTPAIGAAARGTFRFDATAAGIAQAEAHLHRLLPSEAMLLQPYLDRVETDGELSAIFFDGKFSHGVRKIPVPGDYRVQDDFGASDEPARLSDAEVALAQRCLAAVRPDTSRSLLYARADFLRDETGRLLPRELELVGPALFFRPSHHPARRWLVAPFPTR